MEEEKNDQKGEIPMTSAAVDALKRKKCVPCEGGVPVVPKDEAVRLLKDLPGWKLSDDGIRIRRQWVVTDFMTAVDFFNRVADLAEQEGHHPDLHLVGYRNVAIELWTHAIGGLSENDFILAAKIDDLPVAAKS
jgi:4a-hydroxytetrahydrobiopterin dehydratase